jgi:hypothetical protein
MIMKQYPFDGSLPGDGDKYDSVRGLISAAFCLCNLSKSQNWTCPETYTDGTPCDLFDDSNILRGYFLDSLEFALDSNAGPDTLYTDLGERPDGIEWGREGSKDWTRIEWRFNGRDTDGHWCFSLSCTASDDTSIWLESDWLDREEYWMDGVEAYIAEARDALEERR